MDRKIKIPRREFLLQQIDGHMYLVYEADDEPSYSDLISKRGNKKR